MLSTGIASGQTHDLADKMQQQQEEVKTVWDKKTQQYHGGQEWKFLNNFVEDFSVTTNGLGTPVAALNAARKALDHCHHYPPANQEPALTHLAEFLVPPGSTSTTVQDVHDRLLLGNGASELIDLVTRIAPDGPWRSGPSKVQYKEYERSGASNGRVILPYDTQEKAALTCLVNPNNPTGDYMSLPELKAWIETNVPDHGVVMVDESMQPWLPNFHSDSLLSASEWIQSLYSKRNISIYIIHSWTKLWSCTGLRLGSVVCPTVEHTKELRKRQVPWSVNCAALEFLSAACFDRDFLEQTWAVTSKWRKQTVDDISAIVPTAKIYGKSFLSWVWVDFGNEDFAKKFVDACRVAGTPVRPGSEGYKCNTFVRLAVRNEQQWGVVRDVLRKVKAEFEKKN